MRPTSPFIPPRLCRRLAVAAAWAALASPAFAQDVPDSPAAVPEIAPATSPAPATSTRLAQATPAAGRPVVAVRVEGNRVVSDTEILNAVRTKPGAAFDPQTVIEDYQRIYALRRFSRVEARYEETPAGVDGRLRRRRAAAAQPHPRPRQ